MAVVVTVSRQLGSQGSYMAAQAAEQLGFRYLDREILKRAAAEAGYPDERMVKLLARQEEVPGLLQRILDELGRYPVVPSIPSASMREGFGYPTLSDMPTSGVDMEELNRSEAAQAYSELVRRVILKYAEMGNVVIVGRGGQAILRYRPDVLHVLVIASTEQRIRHLMDRQGISQEDAERLIRRSDRQRRRYLEHYFGIKWQDPSLYHLILNADHVSVSMGAALICEGARWLMKADSPRQTPDGGER